MQDVTLVPDQVRLTVCPSVIGVAGAALSVATGVEPEAEPLPFAPTPAPPQDASISAASMPSPVCDERLQVIHIALCVTPAL